MYQDELFAVSHFSLLTNLKQIFQLILGIDEAFSYICVFSLSKVTNMNCLNKDIGLTT